jgi:hypothetical protein
MIPSSSGKPRPMRRTPRKSKKKGDKRKEAKEN